MDEWFAAMDTLKAAGVTPLALGEQWTKMHLLETVLLGTLGADKYNGLWDGTTDWGSRRSDHRAGELCQGLDLHQQQLRLPLTGRMPPNSSSMAMRPSTSWATGLKVTSANWARPPRPITAGLPFPARVGVFQFLSDSFVLAVGAPDREAAIAWLKIAGSKEGQEAFNPVKGSICARTDCDKSLFGEYLQSAMDDWSTNVVVGSLTHGVVANNSWKTEIDTALGLVHRRIAMWPPSRLRSLPPAQPLVPASKS